MSAGRLPAPMLPTLVAEPFDSADWCFEIKWDGVRAICRVGSGGVEAASRTGRDLVRFFPELDELRGAFRRLPVVVDGEIVALDRRGRASFQRLQPRINKVAVRDRPAPIRVRFAVFDILGQGRTDLRDLPLRTRMELLDAQLRDAPGGFAMRSKQMVGRGIALFGRARRMGVEGIVAKRLASTYRAGRSRDWLKIKTLHRQEFAIVGWTEPRGSRRYLGALLLAYHERGALAYAGHVGTGFDEAGLADLHRRLSALEVKRPPLHATPDTNAPVHWARPRLVAEVKFSEWTRDGVLRQPVFLGLRIDKNPADCVREEPS